jgi:hypothetical protein
LNEAMHYKLIGQNNCEEMILKKEVMKRNALIAHWEEKNTVT